MWIPHSPSTPGELIYICLLITLLLGNHPDEVDAPKCSVIYGPGYMNRHMISDRQDGNNIAPLELDRDPVVVVLAMVMVTAVIMMVVVYMIRPGLCRDRAL